MHVESFEKHMSRTCRRCYTIFDFRRDYCCAKGKDECYADLGLVRRGMAQDKKMKDGEMTLILMRGLGGAFVAHKVPREAVRAFLEAQLAK